MASEYSVSADGHGTSYLQQQESGRYLSTVQRRDASPLLVLLHLIQLKISLEKRTILLSPHCKYNLMDAKPKFAAQFGSVDVCTGTVIK